MNNSKRVGLAAPQPSPNHSHFIVEFYPLFSFKPVLMILKKVRRTLEKVRRTALIG
jgi:hypothetical protein